MTTRRAVLASGGWVVARGAAQALEFSAWLVVARRLDSSAVGELAVAAIAARLLGLIGDWGALGRGSRDVAVAGRHSALAAALVVRRERLSALLAAVVAVGLYATGGWALVPMAMVVFARGANRDWIALGDGRRAHAAAPLLIQGVGIVATVLIVPASIGWIAGAFAGGNLAAYVASRQLNRVTAPVGAGRVSLDAWYLLAGISDQILASADTALLLVLRSPEEAGIYNIVYRLPLAWLTISGLVVAAAVPLVTRRLQDTQVDIGRLFRRTDAAALVLAVTVLPVANIALALLTPILGPEYEAGRDALLILFVSCAVTTASAPYRVLITASGADRLVGLLNLGAALLNVALNAVAIPLWGLEGAALTTLAAQLVMLGALVGWSRCERQNRVRTDDQTKAVIEAR